MIIIWWTLYIFGAITLIIVWLNLITLFIKGCTVILKKEWAQVKVIEGPPGPKGEPGERGPRGHDGEQGPRGDFVITSDLRREIDRSIKTQGVLTRKDIESLIRIEVAAHLSKLEISRTTYPGLGKEETKIQMKEDK